MVMVWRLPIITALMGLLLMSQSVQAAAPKKDDRSCHKLIYALLDRSGSFRDQQARAVEELIRVVVKLQEGECFLLKSIGRESFSDQNTLVPFLELPPSSRPFDLAHRRLLVQRKVNTIKQMKQITKRPMDPYTDLWCALQTASRILQHHQGKKHLLLFTDFRDNRHRRSCRSLRLDGVTVEARLIPRVPNEDPAAFERRLRAWMKVLTGAGAAQVAFFDQDGLLLMAEQP